MLTKMMDPTVILSVFCAYYEDRNAISSRLKSKNGSLSASSELK